ncbi:MAG: hypothetical protein U9R57_05180 [Thermodesulfobacteriota bacterium]|nr:hypothetical protein [Thermodesulfobacteriota bacterium]
MKLTKIKILNALPVLGHPRHSKRICMLQQAGFEVEAVAFQREYHSGRSPDCLVKLLGVIDHGRYFVRSLKMLAALPVIRHAIKRNDLVYAFGPDMAFMALLGGLGLGRPVILEIGDIRTLQVAPGLKGYLARVLDRYVANACSLLVATAPGFINDYYREKLGTQTPALIVENKLEFSFTESNSPEVSRRGGEKPLVDGPLRIGYFGVLRCERSWQILEALAESRPQEIEIVVAGYPMDPIDLPERAERKKNIQFIGEYRSPHDLFSLYNKVDIVWACYPFPRPGDLNWRWARTNRFYESCYFQKPMISLAGSGDASEVKRYKIGMVINRGGVGEVVDELCNIKPCDLEFWQDNMKTLPEEVYIYTAEIEELGDSIKCIAKKIAGDGEL